jgi:pentatricopeptide repeat protein
MVRYAVKFTRYGAIIHADVVTTIVDAFGKDGDLENMERWFLRFRKYKNMNEDAGIYATMMRHYVNYEKYDKVFEMFHAMNEDNVAYDATSLCLVMKALLLQGKPHEVLRFFDYVKNFPFERQSKIYATLMKTVGYYCDNIPIMMQIFEKMKEDRVPPDAGVYSSMIAAFGKKGNLKEMLKLYDEMIQVDIQPQKSVFHQLVHSAVAHNDFPLAKRFMLAMEVAGAKLDGRAIAIFLKDLPMDSTTFPIVEKFLKFVEQRNVAMNAVLYRIAIQAYAKVNIDTALKYLEDAKKKIIMRKRLYNEALKGCVYWSKYEMVNQLLREMRKKDHLIPDWQTYAYMLQGCEADRGKILWLLKRILEDPDVYYCPKLCKSILLTLQYNYLVTSTMQQTCSSLYAEVEGKEDLARLPEEYQEDFDAFVSLILEQHASKVNLLSWSEEEDIEKPLSKVLEEPISQQEHKL